MVCWIQLTYVGIRATTPFWHTGPAYPKLVAPISVHLSCWSLHTSGPPLSPCQHNNRPIFTARCYTERGIPIVYRLPVCLCSVHRVLARCLWTFNNSNLLQILKKMQTRKFDFWTHLVLVHITYILIICFNFWLQIADDWRRRRKRSLVNVSCALDPRSVSPLWCSSTYRSWAAQTSFVPPDLWPANSPNLNPVDYRIWSVVQ